MFIQAVLVVFDQPKQRLYGCVYNYDHPFTRQKFGHGTRKKRAGTTYSHGPGPQTFLGTVYTANIEGAGP